MQALETIDLSALVTVTGGKDPATAIPENAAGGMFQNGAGRAKRTYIRGKFNIDPKLGIKVSGEGEYGHALSPYGACLEKLPDNPTTEQLAECGKLAGQQ